MQIHCENCDTVIPAANINIQEKLAVCPQCGSVFSFAEHLTHRPRPRKAKQPQGFTVIQQEDTLDIRFRWIRILKAEEQWFTLLCAVGVPALTALAVTMFNGMNSVIEGVVGVFSVLGALICLYMVLMLLLNEVRITIDEDTIRASHKPVPMPGTKSAPRNSVVRIHCQAAFYNNDDPNTEYVDYDVQLVRHDGTRVTLVTLRRDLALYIADLVESYLYEIADGSVDEEDEQAYTLEQGLEQGRSALAGSSEG